MLGAVRPGGGRATGSDHVGQRAGLRVTQRPLEPGLASRSGQDKYGHKGENTHEDGTQGSHSPTGAVAASTT